MACLCAPPQQREPTHRLLPGQDRAETSRTHLTATAPREPPLPAVGKLKIPCPPHPQAGLFLLQSQLPQLWDNVPGEAGQLTPHFPLLAPIHHQHCKVPTTAPTRASWQPGKVGKGGLEGDELPKVTQTGTTDPRTQPPEPRPCPALRLVPGQAPGVGTSLTPTTKACPPPALPTSPRPGPRGRYRS